jgi:hypothetical protein
VNATGGPAEGREAAEAICTSAVCRCHKREHAVCESAESALGTRGGGDDAGECRACLPSFVGVACANCGSTR